MLTIRELMKLAEHNYHATLAAECQDEVDPKKAAEFPSLAEWLLKIGHTEEEIWDIMPTVAVDAGFDEPAWL